MNLTNCSNLTATTLTGQFIPNPHMSFVHSIAFTVLSLLVISLALSGNFFLIVNLLKKTPCTINRNLMILMCLTDVVKCLFFFVIFNVPVFFGSWELSGIACRIFPFFFAGFEILSLKVLIVLAQVRCYAIVKPLTLDQRPKRVYGEVVWQFASTLGYQDYKPLYLSHVSEFRGQSRCVKKLGMANSIVCQALHFVIAHAVMLYCYIKIRKALQQNSTSIGGNNELTSQRISRNKKALRTIFTSVLAFDVIFLPAVLLCIAGLVYSHVNVELSVFLEWGELLKLTYSCVNPALFIWRNDELKKALKDFVGIRNRATNVI